VADRLVRWLLAPGTRKRYDVGVALCICLVRFWGNFSYPGTGSPVRWHHDDPKRAPSECLAVSKSLSGQSNHNETIVDARYPFTKNLGFRTFALSVMGPNRFPSRSASLKRAVSASSETVRTSYEARELCWIV
jgi:hypothetical protein